jgi:hypothetical protein
MYCIRAASEAVPLGEEVHLPVIFSPTVFERLPPGPNQELSDLALRLIGTSNALQGAEFPCPTSEFGPLRCAESYEEWFKYHPTSVTFVLNYVVTAIDTPSLSSLGARVLKALCDLCRSELKQHVEAFGILHGRIGSLQVSDRFWPITRSKPTQRPAKQPPDQVKVIEAITSILQALPPSESVTAVIVSVWAIMC